MSAPDFQPGNRLPPESDRISAAGQSTSISDLVPEEHIDWFSILRTPGPTTELSKTTQSVQDAWQTANYELESGLCAQYDRWQGISFTQSPHCGVVLTDIPQFPDFRLALYQFPPSFPGSEPAPTLRMEYSGMMQVVSGSVILRTECRTRCGSFKLDVNIFSSDDQPHPFVLPPADIYLTCRGRGKIGRVKAVLARDRINSVFTGWRGGDFPRMNEMPQNLKHGILDEFGWLEEPATF